MELFSKKSLSLILSAFGYSVRCGHFFHVAMSKKEPSDVKAELLKKIAILWYHILTGKILFS